MPRARLETPDGKTTEWKSALRAYQRRTLAADALIAGTYLAGTNTRRVRRALAALFGGAVGKDTVSRVWRKVKTDWDAWNARSLAGRADRAADPRRHGRARAARPQGDLDLAARRARRAARRPEGAARDQEHGRRERRGLARAPRRSHRARSATPEFLIVDGAPGLDKAIAAAVDGRAGPALHGPQAPQPARPCARAPARGDHRRLQRHDLRRRAQEIESARKAFIRKWRLKCRAVADSLEEAGDRLFTFTRLPPSQWNDPHHECDRAAARGVQATDQDPDRAAIGGHRRHAVLGAAGLRPDQHAQGRRLADARHKAHRSAD